MTAVWVARERGLFKKHGLDMQFILMPRNPLAVAALIAGEIDVAIVGPGASSTLVSAAQILSALPTFIKSSTFGSTRGPTSRKPRIFGASRSPSAGRFDFACRLHASAAGPEYRSGARADRFLDDSGTKVNRRLALETGGVDATSLRGAVGDLYGNKGYHVLYNLKATGATLPQNTLVTTRRTAATKPQVIEAYLKTMIEAIAITLDPANKELVTRLLMSNLRLTNPADAEESYLAVINSYERAPHTSLEGMKRLQVLLTQINPKIAEVRVENLIDTSFMNKLESSGYLRASTKSTNALTCSIVARIDLLFTGDYDCEK